MENASYLLFGIICFLLTWLFFDSMSVRFQLRSFLKLGGFLLLGISSFSTIFVSPFDDLYVFFFIYPTSIALYLLYLGYMFDAHSKFSLGIILMIIAFFFLRGHALLALQASLVALVVLQMAYMTQHRDFIPLGVGFVLVAIGEFLKGQEVESEVSAAFLYIFATGFFFVWWWQYIGPRLKLKLTTLRNSSSTQT